ncbi:MAG: RNA-binding S4 domain-containing protein [Verrucomicrobiales bacterium]|nr:RNA-binding S4 domain-containing protein [Verrucomicrobiales bacterium]
MGRGKTDGESVRVDVWTWAVRLYKTRDLAGAACKKEQIVINGQRCRPSRHVRVGDRLEVRRGILTRSLEVRAILSKRVGAAVVDDFLIDHTPQEVYDAAAEAMAQAREATPRRESGSGRPTKRQRRELEEIMEEAVEERESFEAFVKSFTRPN